MNPTDRIQLKCQSKVFVSFIIQFACSNHSYLFMLYRNSFIFILILICTSVRAQIIYKGGQTLITGTWQGNGTLAETNANQPHEGTQHYGFTYNITNFWGGYGLNMDNWYTGPGINFSGHSHLRLAYRGLSSGHTLSIRLRQGQNTNGADYQIGGSASVYQVVDIPMTALTGSSGINLNAISEINISVDAPSGNGTGTLYIDAIELVNLDPPPPSVAWPRCNTIDLGLNLANWLEAYWLLPFGTYPETNRYTRADMVFFKNAGFKTIRMPVIFERLSQNVPPYTLNTAHPAFTIIDSVIAWSNALNMKLIVVNHHGYDLNNSNYQAQIPRLQAIWQQIMTKYNYLNADNVFFEIFNEPTNAISNANFRAVATSIISTIRTVSTAHTLVLGGNNWNSAAGLTGITPYNDPNIIYTFHNYDPYFFTHQGLSFSGLPAGVSFPQGSDLADLDDTYQSVKDWSDQYNMPVFLGEYACSSVADPVSRCNWISAVSGHIDEHDFPHAYWAPKFFTDDFGFFNGGNLTANDAIPCFVTAMHLNLTALPVDFLAAYTRCEDRINEIAWSAHVTDLQTTFEVERSQDGIRWETAGTVGSLWGTNDYRFEDLNANGDGFYRLVYLDADGDYTYSPIVKSRCDQNTSLQVFPNPTADYVVLTLLGDTTETGQINIFDAQGCTVRTESVSLNLGINTLRFELEDLPKGFYSVVWQDEKGQIVEAGKLLKQ